MAEKGQGVLIGLFRPVPQPVPHIPVRGQKGIKLRYDLVIALPDMRLLEHLVFMPVKRIQKTRVAQPHLGRPVPGNIDSLRPVRTHNGHCKFL